MKKRTTCLLLFLSVCVISCRKSSDKLPESNISASDLSVTIDENPSNGMVLGTISGTSDAGSITYSITSSAPEDAFAIDSFSGELSVADKYLFDYETFPVLNAKVVLDDGIGTATSTVTVSLNDLEFVWTGEKMTFYKSAYANTDLETSQDRITENVWLTRGSSGVLINKVAGSIGCSPANVKMAYGTAADRTSLTFSDCMEKLEGSNLNQLPGKDVVFYLVADDVYLDVHFISWSANSSGGGFSYERSTQN